MRPTRFAALGATALWLMVWSCGPPDQAVVEGSWEQIARPARIDPDYAGVVIPPNIAPLNFRVEESGTEYRIEVSAPRGETIVITTTEPQIHIPTRRWKDLLDANRGEEIRFGIHTRREDGAWVRFEPLVNRIAAQDIDAYLVYRLLKPLYNKYVDMGIYQRHLETFDESAILENRHADQACLNCHTFVANQPDPMVLQTRSRHGLAMLVARDGQVATVEPRTAFNTSPAGYTSWHPDGEHMVFSLNKVSLFLHTDPTRETREVYDTRSDLALFSTKSSILTTNAGISDPDRAENWPEWSPDGRHLYFSSSPLLPIERASEVQYDLMRISYDAGSGAWGSPETVLSAQETGLSATQAKISPDGRFLVCTLAESGSFPIFHQSSDLYLLDLQSGQHRRLEINSEQTESWHFWSSNSRWLVFSSKRRDGLFARPYFSYVDVDGRFHKPVLMPQQDPQFYDSYIKTYNVPVFITGPVEVSQRQLARAIYAPSHPVAAHLDPQVQVQGRGASPAASDPYSPGSSP